MISKPDNNFQSTIMNAIQSGIKRIAEEEFERTKKEMNTRLEEQKADFIAGISINIMRRVKMETLGDNLVITIDQENKK